MSRSQLREGTGEMGYQPREEGQTMQQAITRRDQPVASNSRHSRLIALIVGFWFACHAALGIAGDAVLTWSPNTEPDLAGYTVHHGGASGSYTTVINIGNTTTHTITGLGLGTRYFAITAYDSSGNDSAFSLEVSKTFSDTTAPVISGIAVTGTAGTQATITWITDEAATSQVEYGTTTAFGTTSALGTALVTSHSRTLSGLTPDTTYYFRVVNIDASGNTAVSSANTFTTLTAPDTTAPVLSNILAVGVTSNSSTLTWTTNEAATTQVQYGTTATYGSTTTENPSLLTAHSQVLNGLNASTTYHFSVHSRDAAGNVAVSGDLTFTTSPAADTTAPVISGIAASNSTPSTTIITWGTNEPATSQVEYGLTSSYGSPTPLDGTLVTSHSTTLSGLTLSTTYHYRVRSSDAAGNAAASSDQTFTTSPATDTTPPIISGVTSGTVTATSAEITWTTNEAATSLVQYGTTSSVPLSSALNTTPVTTHSRSLSGLVPATAYSYRVVSADTTGNTATSGLFTFTTSAAPDTSGPIFLTLTATDITPTSALIRWTTDEPASSLVEYGPTTSYGLSVPLNATLVTSHAEALGGLTPTSTYHVRAQSADAAGNVSRSPDYVFTTPVLDTTPPADVQDFSAQGETRSVRLTWVNPPDRDFAGVHILYRTDRFPHDTNDGTVLGDFTGVPGDAMRALHTDLLNGVTYYYAAAAYDNNGNQQNTVYALASPVWAASSDTEPIAGGCGIIKPGSGTPVGPWSAADWFITVTVALFLMRRRWMYPRLWKPQTAV